MARVLSAGAPRVLFTGRFTPCLVIQLRGPFPLGASEGVIGPVLNGTEGLRHESEIAQSGDPFNSVARAPLFPYPEVMEVHFTPDIETRLQQVALANGKDAEQLVKDTVARMLESQARFVAGVEQGIAAAERGELIDHEDVVKRINRLFEP